MAKKLNDFSGVYYKPRYWNDLYLVKKYINKKFTNNSKTEWVFAFKRKYAKKPIKKALFINCGNGWVERMFIDNKIVEQAVAFDISKKLIDQAVRKRGKRCVEYFTADVNKIELRENEYDLIVNVAALHHVQYINRLAFQLAKSLKKNGLMVNFDYVGPYRNQWTTKQWNTVVSENNMLPESLRHKSLFYPSVPVMLKEDPTEAVHSDLIIPVLHRYFHFVENKEAGGGLAYLLLTHNNAVFSHIKERKVQQLVKNILQLDNELHQKKILPNLFSYFILKPNKKIIASGFIARFWQIEEEVRETLSTIFWNTYRIRDVGSVVWFKAKQIIKYFLKIKK